MAASSTKDSLKAAHYNLESPGISFARLTLRIQRPMPSNNNEPLRLLTFTEASRALQVSKRTLLKLIQQNEVPAFKVGGQWRIRETRLRKWIEGKENPTSVLE